MYVIAWTIYHLAKWCLGIELGDSVVHQFESLLHFDWRLEPDHLQSTYEFLLSNHRGNILCKIYHSPQSKMGFMHPIISHILKLNCILMQSKYVICSFFISFEKYFWMVLPSERNCPQCVIKRINGELSDIFNASMQCFFSKVWK